MRLSKLQSCASRCTELQRHCELHCRQTSRAGAGRLVAAAQKNKGIYFDYEPVDADDARQVPIEREKRQEEFSWVQRARGGASRTNQQSGAKRGASRNDKHSSKPTAPQGSSQVKVKTEHDRQRTASRQGVTAAKTKEGNGQSVDGHKQGSQSNPAPKPAQGAPQDSLAVGVAAQPSAHMSQSNALQPEQLKQDVTDQSTLQAKAAAAALALSSVAGVAPEDLEAHQLLLKIFPPDPGAGAHSSTASLQASVSKELQAEEDYTAWLASIDPSQLVDSSADGEQEAQTQPRHASGTTRMPDTVQLLQSGADQLREFQALLGQLQVEGEADPETAAEDESMPDDQVLRVLAHSDPALAQLLQGPLMPDGEVEELERALTSLSSHLDSVADADAGSSESMLAPSASNSANEAGEDSDDIGDEGLSQEELEELFKEDPELRDLFYETSQLDDRPVEDGEEGEEGEVDDEDLELGELFDALEEDPDIEPADRARAQFALSSIFNANLAPTPEEPGPVTARPEPVRASQVLAPKPARPASST